MKMLGFMITLTLAYWLVASYAQSVILNPEPCSAGAEIASAEPMSGAGDASAAVTLRGRWSNSDAYEVIEAAAPQACAG